MDVQVRRLPRTTVPALAAAAAILLAAAADLCAEGRWVTHITTDPPASGTVGQAADRFVVPETSGHWVWLVWYDLSAGQWTYDPAQPYWFSVDGTIEFHSPQSNRWYFLLLYDTVQNIYY